MKGTALLALLVGGLAGAQPDAFVPTGSMITPRFSHTATLLPNGQVLIAGGYSTYFYQSPSSTSLNTAEVYDPVTGTFAPTGNMSSYAQHTGGILLPNGQVLFAGTNFTGTPAIVELYDPSSGSFSVAGDAAMLTSVDSATLLNDGGVLLTGYTSGPSSVYGAELYDPGTGTLSSVANWPK
jgi:hypothetical protein